MKNEQNITVFDRWLHPTHWAYLSAISIPFLPFKEGSNVPMLTDAFCVVPFRSKTMASWWLSHPVEKYARQIGSFRQGSG